MLTKHGGLDTRSITASIINLAVNKYLTIQELNEKILIFSSKDYRLTKTDDAEQKLNQLDASERLLFQSLFGSAKSIKISSLKDKFYKKIDPIKQQLKIELLEKGVYEQSGFDWQNKTLTAGIILLVLAFLSIFIAFAVPLLFVNLLISGIIALIFSAFMSKMTAKGAEMLWKTKGFKLFMLTAEKYRQQFNEKENIFEKFLPYAITFDIVKQWSAKMEEIYGKEYMQSHYPVWYSGVGSIGAFDANAFSSSLTAMSSNMSSTMSSSPSSSGSGGGGFSGGGGGGGGGGGW